MPHIATCHCGATRIEVDRLPEEATACTCTFCSKRGALWGYYAEGEMRVIAEGAPAVYAPSLHNLHHFCATCGCTTYSLCPDWATMEGEDYESAPKRPQINLRLLDDVDLGAIPVVELDGRSGW